MEKFDLGDLSIRIIDKDGKNATGFLYSSEKRAQEEMTRLELKDCKVETIDTRKTFKEIAQYLNEQEKEVWDEYISFNGYNDEGRKISDRWPEVYRWVAVYVVTGSSEGMYLHVDIITRENERLHIFTGKTLSSRHTDELWASAGRIAAILQA